MAGKQGTIDPETGEFVTPAGDRVMFLPPNPSNTPPHELVVTTEADEDSADGFKHYLIGGDPAIVAAIVDWYAKRKEPKPAPVPAGYAEEAAAHADRVAAAKAAGG